MMQKMYRQPFSFFVLFSDFFFCCFLLLFLGCEGEGPTVLLATSDLKKKYWLSEKKKIFFLVVQAQI